MGAAQCVGVNATIDDVNEVKIIVEEGNTSKSVSKVGPSTTKDDVSSSSSHANSGSSSLRGSDTPPPSYTSECADTEENVIPYLIQPLLEKTAKLESDVEFWKRKATTGSSDRIEVSFILEGEWQGHNQSFECWREFLMQVATALELSNERVIFDQVNTEERQLQFAILDHDQDLQDVAKRVAKLKKVTIGELKIRKIAMKAVGMGILQKTLQAQVEKCQGLEEQLAMQARETAL